MEKIKSHVYRLTVDTISFGEGGIPESVQVGSFSVPSGNRAVFVEVAEGQEKLLKPFEDNKHIAVVQRPDGEVLPTHNALGEPIEIKKLEEK